MAIEDIDLGKFLGSLEQKTQEQAEKTEDINKKLDGISMSIIKIQNTQLKHSTYLNITFAVTASLILPALGILITWGLK